MADNLMVWNRVLVGEINDGRRPDVRRVKTGGAAPKTRVDKGRSIFK